MPNGNLQNATLELKVPTFLPFSDAARKYNLSEKALTQLIEAGKIEAVQLPSGELLVSAENGHQITKEEIIVEEFAHLRGRPITIADASQIYDVPNSTLRDWIALNYIDTVDDSYPVKIDESDVAYCAKIYNERKGKRGKRIFDKDGNPYQLKHPKLAEYRYRRKEEID